MPVSSQHASERSRKSKPRGKHPHNRLSAAFVRTAPPGRHFDGQGLFLLVENNSARRWGQRLTVRGKRRKLGLGGWPVVSLAEAREKALENRRLAKRGGDPLPERTKPSEIVTFESAVDRYLSHKLKEFKNEKRKKDWPSSLNRYAMPVLGRIPVGQITMQNILRVLEPIWTEKTETAQRVRGRIEAVL